jgi:hypothetical protein
MQRGCASGIKGKASGTNFIRGITNIQSPIHNYLSDSATSGSGSATFADTTRRGTLLRIPWADVGVVLAVGIGHVF